MADFKTSKVSVEAYYAQSGPLTVEKITSDPTYNKLRSITNKLESKLAGINDVQDATYGKMFLMRDVQHLDGGQPVTPSTDQGQSIQNPGTPILEMQENIRNWNYFQTMYKEDKMSKKPVKNGCLNTFQKNILED